MCRHFRMKSSGTSGRFARWPTSRAAMAKSFSRSRHVCRCARRWRNSRSRRRTRHWPVCATDKCAARRRCFRKLDKRAIRHLLSRMKMPFVIALLLASRVFSFAAATNKPPAATTEPAAEKKEKTDIKDLIQEKNFTNATGMVMVKISPSMWAGKYEVTQKEYQEIAGSNPSKFSGQNNPVDSVSWNDARSFCSKLNEAEKKEDMLPEGYTYTLPTQ